LDMDDTDRQTVLSFLSGKQGEAAPGTDQIVGILKTMKDEMTGGLADAQKAEEEAVATYGSLMSAKKKEVNAATKMTEEKLQRVGQLATEIETKKNELEDTKDRLAEDSKSLATFKTTCKTRRAEVDKSRAIRQEELVALADTIKVLNDDDTLELMKKTLPSASSFMQIQVSAQSMRKHALQMLVAGRQPRHGSVQLDFIALALRGKKAGFEGVIQMIDKLSATLKAEQKADNDEKAYCAAEFDKADDKKKSLERTISNAESALGKAKEDIESLAEDIAALKTGLADLDKSVAQATAQRKEENAEHQSLMQNNGAAKQVLEFAKNRLNKFYNPALYKAPPKRELSEADQITVNNGGTLAPTAAPGGVAGTGIGASFVQVEAHHTGGKSSGVIRMIELLVADLDKQMTESETEEKDAQGDYETTMSESTAKRTTDAKALAENESSLADAEASLEELTANKKSATKELSANKELAMSLHSQCDWLIEYFEVRKQARSSEIEAMTNAKAVLSGAADSFLQVASSRHFLA